MARLPPVMAVNAIPTTVGAPSIAVGPSDWVELLNYGLLLGGSAKKGRFTVFSDVVILSLSSKDDDRVRSVEDTIQPLAVELGNLLSGQIFVRAAEHELCGRVRIEHDLFDRIGGRRAVRGQDGGGRVRRLRLSGK